MMITPRALKQVLWELRGVLSRTARKKKKKKNNPGWEGNRLDLELSGATFTHDFLRCDRPPTPERSFVRIWSGRALTWA